MPRAINRSRIALLAAILTSGMGMSASADAMRYTVTDLGTLPGPADQRYAPAIAFGLNDRGQVVGVSEGSPFLYSSGKMMPLDVQAYAINNSGQLATSTSYGFIPGSINSSGQIPVQLNLRGHPRTSSTFLLCWHRP